MGEIPKKDLLKRYLLKHVFYIKNRKMQRLALAVFDRSTALTTINCENWQFAQFRKVIPAQNNW